MMSEQPPGWDEALRLAGAALEWLLRRTGGGPVPAGPPGTAAGRPAARPDPDSTGQEPNRTVPDPAAPDAGDDGSSRGGPDHTRDGADAVWSAVVDHPDTGPDHPAPPDAAAPPPPPPAPATPPAPARVARPAGRPPVLWPGHEPEADWFGGPECRICPWCRALAWLRTNHPDSYAQLSAVLEVAAELFGEARTHPGPKPPGRPGLQHIDIDEGPWD